MADVRHAVRERGGGPRGVALGEVKFDSLFFSPVGKVSGKILISFDLGWTSSDEYFPCVS